MHPVLAFMLEHQQAMIQDLEAVVRIESPSGDKAAVDRLGGHLARLFEETGAAVEVLPRAERGDILRISFGQGREPGQTLVLCHMDTVFAVGDIARNPVRIEDGRLYGPGVCDMKAGIIFLLWAFRCMKQLGLRPRRDVVALLTSDEEVGSDASRDLIEAEARRSAVALVLEAPTATGALKTWRKGMAVYRVLAYGKAAHAGVDPTKGINAIVELAHQILAIQNLADPEAGTTVTIGVVQGGTRPNVVPAEAWVDVDVRYMSMEEAHRVDQAIRALQPVLPGAVLRVEGGIKHPPMVRGEATGALFRLAQSLAAELGFAVEEAGTGGVSDGNFAAAAGCPTLDGLGACGDGLHTLHEYVEVDSLPRRAALLVRLLQEA
ncbi:MAG TPA: M20 family metallopeptidase [Symbiobacteriaceae bacterium]